jgi:hypothetical protein
MVCLRAVRSLCVPVGQFAGPAAMGAECLIVGELQGLLFLWMFGLGIAAAIGRMSVFKTLFFTVSDPVTCLLLVFAYWPRVERKSVSETSSSSDKSPYHKLSTQPAFSALPNCPCESVSLSA